MPDPIFIGVLTANLLGIAEIGATVITAMMSGACISTCCGGKGFGFQHTDTETSQIQATNSNSLRRESNSNRTMTPLRLEVPTSLSRNSEMTPRLEIHSPRRHDRLKRSHSESSL